MKSTVTSITENAKNEALEIAKNCKHFAMCKIDFLGSGVCASGLEKHYVSFYPQGRMDLYAAIAENMIPVTEKCVQIADSCNLCGKCDCQCYFVNEMRPSKVMRALKDYVSDYLKSGGEIAKTQEDTVLSGIRKIVGKEWATNDPAVLIAYHHDICPHVEYKLPRYIVMPNSKDEISSIVKLLDKYEIPYVVRGNGASSHGLVFTDGAVLDLGRMRTIDFREKNWYVKVGPGVAAFDLQSEAGKRGYRVNTAEPASLVCANIMTSGLLSVFSTAYGVSADNYIDAEFIAHDGTLFSLNDLDAPNLFSYQNRNSEHEAVAICVSVSMKLHPITSDEEGILVPFNSLSDALEFSKNCAMRHIGLAIGLLGGIFISSFLAPTKELASMAKNVFAEKLGITYLVLLVGDTYALRSVSDMGYPFINQDLFKTLYMGLPALQSAKWLDLLSDLSDDEPFSYLQLSRFGELAKIALSPSPGLMSADLDADLRPFFEKVYMRPEMTDLTWLTAFRIQSSRYCREKPCVALVMYLPMDASLVAEIEAELGNIAEKHRLSSELGFITPIDCGKRCVWEYDYYFNQNDPDELSRIRQATHEAGTLLDEYSAKTGTIRQIRYVVNRGCCRKENLLYI